MIIFYNATVIDGGRSWRGYVTVEGAEIADVCQGDPDMELLERCANRIDLSGAWLLPGVIDTHVHLREPGMTAKADIAGESRAMAAGGVTSWIDMPNTLPPTTTPDTLADKQRRARESSLTNYAFYIGATADNIDTLAHKVDYTGVAGVKLFLGSSTGNLLLNDDAPLRRLFGSVPALIAVHSEDEAIIRSARETLVSGGSAGLSAANHPQMRPREACFEATRRVVELARQTGARLHILHISTADELALLSDTPLSASKRITAEACAGHLLFADTDYARLGNRIKVNPAIKTEADRNALRHAIDTDLIDTIATDHAPHTLEEKQRPYLDAPSGMPLGQFSLPMVFELAEQGAFTLERAIGKMTNAPARLFGIERRGYLRPGYYADLTIVARQPEPYTITDADVRSRCRWTPLAGTPAHHRVLLTMVNGQIVYDPVKNGIGATTDPSPAMPLKFNH